MRKNNTMEVFPDKKAELSIKPKLSWNTPKVVDLDINKTLNGPTASTSENFSSHIPS